MNYKVGDEVVYSLDNPETGQPLNPDWGIITKIENGKVYIKHPYACRTIKTEVIPIPEFEKGIRNTKVILSSKETQNYEA